MKGDFLLCTILVPWFSGFDKFEMCRTKDLKSVANEKTLASWMNVLCAYDNVFIPRWTVC